MPYGIDDNAKNAMLDAIFGSGPASGTYCALLTGEAPANYADAQAKEVAGGFPTYGRRQLNLSPAASGFKSLAANAIFDVPGGTTITGVAFWRVAIGGTPVDYLGAQAINQPVLITSQGTYVLTAESFTL